MARVGKIVEIETYLCMIGWTDKLQYPLAQLAAWLPVATCIAWMCSLNHSLTGALDLGAVVVGSAKDAEGL